MAARPNSKYWKDGKTIHGSLVGEHADKPRRASYYERGKGYYQGNREKVHNAGMIGGGGLLTAGLTASHGRTSERGGRNAAKHEWRRAERQTARQNALAAQGGVAKAKKGERPNPGWAPAGLLATGSGVAGWSSYDNKRAGTENLRRREQNVKGFNQVYSQEQQRARTGRSTLTDRVVPESRRFAEAARDTHEAGTAQLRAARNYKRAAIGMGGGALALPAIGAYGSRRYKRGYQQQMDSLTTKNSKIPSGARKGRRVAG